MATSSVLVTGGAGYIGSHVVLALLDSGRRPVVLDDLSTGARAAVPDGAPFCQGSVLDGGLLAELLPRHEIEAIIHLAGSISVEESVREPAKYYRNNTVGTLQLAKAALKAGVARFIFSSSAAVYGVPDASPVNEDAPLRPISPYGNSKLMSEEMLRDIAAASPRFRPVSLRYFNVAGADPKGRAGQQGPNTTHLIRVAIETALGIRPQIQVFGTDYPTRDGTGERDYIHVSDLAAAHVAALRYLDEGGAATAVNCGCGRGYTVLEVLRTVESVVGRKLPMKMTDRRAGDPPSLVSEVGRIGKELGWRAEHPDVSEMVSTALAWQEKLTARRPG